MEDHNNFSSMYREHIMDIYRNPSNYGILKNPTNQHTGYNALCGDEITIQIKSNKDKIDDIKFHGSGCVISMVSASLLTNNVKGKEISEINELGKKEILELLKVNVNPARMKCALLPLETLKKSLENAK